MTKYTIETLSKINQRFILNHGNLTQSDVDKVNNYIALIEESRTETTARIGDILQYTNEYGQYNKSAHIDTIENGEANICENASVSISQNDDFYGFYFSTSGGDWHNLKLDNFKYMGKVKKTFWTFGHMGACASGGIYFEALVNVWECNENKKEFSTKTHDDFYIYYHKNGTQMRYKFTALKDATSINAWKTEEELMTWARTHRATFEKGYNCIIAWTYKEIEHHVSPTEYAEIQGIEDIMQCNGKRMCKRIYDDKNYILHTYFVWYWEDETITDFAERSMKQNEIRKQYEVDYNVPVNIYALEELRQGKTKKINIMKYFEQLEED